MELYAHFHITSGKSKIFANFLANGTFVRLQVSLQTNRGEHFCGGSWVEKGNSTFVVTAAHCVVNTKGVLDPRMVFKFKKLQFICSKLNAVPLVFQIRVMADDTSIAFHSAPGSRRQYRRVRKLIPHPTYTTEGVLDDIAILIVCTT